MPSEVAHPVDTGGTYPVLEFSGVLDEQAGHQVRSALLTALADQPEGLIVEVAGLTPAGTGGAGAAAAGSDVFDEVARLNADWPGTRVVLSTGDTAWRTEGWPRSADRDAALEVLGPPRPGDRIRQDLEPVVGAARRARELVTAACAAWDIPRVTGHGCIVVTEMVNNVVAHAKSAMTVLIGRHGDAVSVAVRDHSAELPNYRGGPPAPTSYGGRGLLLIDSVSRRWGHLAVPGGKIVWSVLDEEPALP